MGLRMAYKDKSTEDFNERPQFSAEQQQGFSPEQFQPGITKAMAVAAGWPGPGAGAHAFGTNRPGQGMVPGVGNWSPGVGNGAFNPNAPVYATGQGNPMGYGANSGWSGPGNPHSGGWGLGVFGGPMGGSGSPEGMAEAGGEIGYSGGFGDSSESGRNR
tara:strand:+ start:346 stop:822 length:477 start_codon:yes stop_codon:yes gene_type:complete